MARVPLIFSTFLAIHLWSVGPAPAQDFSAGGTPFEFSAGVGVKAWLATWENDVQQFETDGGEMFGFSGMMRYGRADLSLAYLDGDFDLKGEGLNASREEFRLALGYSVTDMINVFIGLSDRSGSVESRSSEIINQVVGTDTNNTPIIQQTTRDTVRSIDYEIQGFYLGASLTFPIGHQGFFGYSTLSIHPASAIKVASFDRDDGFGVNFELGLGYAVNHVAAKIGYRAERLDNGDDFEEQLGGIVLVASVSL